MKATVTRGRYPEARLSVELIDYGTLGLIRWSDGVSSRVRGKAALRRQRRLIKQSARSVRVTREHR